MSALLLCIVAFAATVWAAKRSLGWGLIAVAVTGYFYGILRANFTSAASHFIFDASVAGLYLAYGSKFFDSKDHGRTSKLRMWTAILIAWPCLLCLLPFQPLMVSLVGLRGNVFFLPLLLIGSSLREEDLRKLTNGLAILNLAALAVGLAEYFLGIERFFPRSEVTAIMYNSGDVAGGNYRIPSLFTSAHAYAGTMVATLPYLFGAWTLPGKSRTKQLLLLSMGAALVGVLLASTRTYVVIALLFVLAATFSGSLSMRKRLVWIAAIVLVGALAMTNERFQRFKSLDSELMMDRIAGSVNRSFLEILMEYPMGNGLGGGGTSMPYFLQGQVRNPVSNESEYARIVAEQGLIGFALWIGFILWCVTRRTAFVEHPWRPARRLIWFWYAFSFVSVAIGLGMLTAIPETFFFLLSVGWAVVLPRPEPPIQPMVAFRKQTPRHQLRPVYGK